MGVDVDGLADLQASLEAATEGLDGEAAAVVGTNVDYAPDVEYGTGPHPISPNDAEALHWTEGGEDVFVSGTVMHPGTPPQPFMRPAVRETARNMPAIVGDADSVEAAVERTAAHVERLAKRKAPVDTGTLRASIRWVML